jgi:hypothetical protein
VDWALPFAIGIATVKATLGLRRSLLGFILAIDFFELLVAF